MANKDKIIQITFKGNDQLSEKIKKLDKSTKALVNSQFKLAHQGKKLKQQQDSLDDSSKKLGNTNRMLGGTFAVLRSRMLLVNFALGLGIRQIGRFVGQSAKVESMETAFNTLSGATEDSSVALRRLKEATNNTMSEFDLFQQANNLSLIHI